MKPTLFQQVQAAINCASRENESNTPDFILAEFLIGCLKQYENAVQARDRWYGIEPRPGWTPQPTSNPNKEQP